MHSLYLVDEVEKDPVSREQMLKMEKAFQVAESGRMAAVAAQAKLKEEKTALQAKLKEAEGKLVSARVENGKLCEEVDRLRLSEEEAVQLRKQIEGFPALIAESARSAGERAVEDFKESAEMAQLLKDQHRKSVTENTNLYRSRGWLNVDKFRADREADRAAVLAKRAEAEQRQAEADQGQAEADQGQAAAAEGQAEKVAGQE